MTKEIIDKLNDIITQAKEVKEDIIALPVTDDTRADYGYDKPENWISREEAMRLRGITHASYFTIWARGIKTRGEYHSREYYKPQVLSTPYHPRKLKVRAA